jgi:hypothetical protein
MRRSLDADASVTQLGKWVSREVIYSFHPSSAPTVTRSPLADAMGPRASIIHADGIWAGHDVTGMNIAGLPGIPVASARTRVVANRRLRRTSTPNS